MNIANNIVNEYLRRNASVISAGQDVEKKRAEIADLEKTIAAKKIEIDQINAKLSRAEIDMSLGYLSNDQFLELKRSIGEKETERANYGEVLAAQSSALVHIENVLETERRELGALFPKVAMGIKCQLSKEIIDAVGDKIETMVNAIIAAYGVFPASNLEALNEYRTQILKLVGEAFCNDLITDGNAPLNTLPNKFQARQHVEALVSRTA